mmetsp:Transcript_32461/g.65151  ORF Transcript_32461/g.65151 Transcript_32461/m.65151 type:complete len:141 (-) Transcript_32461:197-619(-)
MAFLQQPMQVDGLVQVENHLQPDGSLVQNMFEKHGVAMSHLHDHTITNVVEMMEGISLRQQRSGMPTSSHQTTPMCTEPANGSFQDGPAEYAHVYLCEDQWSGRFDSDQNDDETGRAFMQQMQWCIQNDLAISAGLHPMS